MKLLIITNNSWAVRQHLEITGCEMSPSRRHIEIDLTPEQIGKIDLQKVGQNGLHTVYETIESVSIIMDEFMITNNT